MTKETGNSEGSGASRQLKETPRERIIREDTENRKGQSGYIIYEDEIQRVVRLVRKFNLVGWFPFFDLIRSRPHPAPAPEESLEDKIRYTLAIEVPELSITRNEILVDRIMEYIAEDTSNTSASQRIEALGLLKEHFIWKRDVQRNQLFDAQNVLDAIEEAEQRAIALLQAGRK